MTDTNASTPEGQKREVLASQESASKPEQLELFRHDLFKELMAVERQRLEASTRRTDVVKMLVEANDAADKRQYEFQMAKLESGNVDLRNRHTLLSRTILGGGIFVILVVALFLYMAFFGNENQRETAIKILTVFGTGLGGAGIFRIVTEGLKRISSKPQS